VHDVLVAPLHTPAAAAMNDWLVGWLVVGRRACRGA
jgi:hypothetical protein